MTNLTYSPQTPPFLADASKIAALEDKRGSSRVIMKENRYGAAGRRGESRDYAVVPLPLETVSRSPAKSCQSLFLRTS